MFFSKYIRHNPFNHKLAVIFINSLIKFLRFFLPSYKNFTNNVVIVVIHRLGDAVFTIPAIKQVINYHKSNIHLICFEETIPIYKIALDSVNFIEIRKSDFLFDGRIARSKVRKVLKNINPEVVYDLTGNFMSASIILFSNAKKIIGVNEIYYKSIYTNYTNLRSIPHMTDNYLDAIRDILPIHDLSYLEVKNNFTQEYILVHPFASYNAKEWGFNKFLKLIESLNNRKYKCVFVIPPKRISYDLTVEIEKKNIRFVETNTVDDLIHVISKCAMLIGNDSGPVQIANLLGKPTFTIYGPTNPLFHKALDGCNDYAIKQLPCSPQFNMKMCFTYGGVFCPSNECLNSLSFEEVEKNLNSFILKNNIPLPKVIS